MKNRYPRRITEEKSHLLASANEAKKNFEAILAEAERMLKRDPDEAQRKSNSAQTEISRLQQEIRGFKERLGMFDAARASHAQHLKAAEDSTESVNLYLVELMGDGYRLSPNIELQSTRMAFKKAQEGLKENKDVPDYIQIVRDAEKAKHLALSVKNDWQSLVKVRGENEKAIEAFQDWHRTTFFVSIAKYSEMLGKLQEIAPKEIWEPVARDADSLKLALTERKDALLDEVLRFNNMEVQGFTKAAEKLEQLSTLKKNFEEAHSRPAAVQREVLQARNKAGILLSEASNKIERANRAIVDRDAEGVGKSKLQEAESSFSKARELSKSNLPNWIALVALIGGAIVLAESAERAAKSRAHEVESSRRRQNDYHRSSSWSSSSSSHGSGFSGFGGGGFGGGGASGGW